MGNIRQIIIHKFYICPVIALEPLETSSPSSNRTHGLRIAFSFGNRVLRGPQGTSLDGRLLCGGVTECNSDTGSRKLGVPKVYSVNMWSNGYHLYELEWKRDITVSRVDGRLYGSTVTGAPFNKPVGLIIILSPLLSF